MLALLNVIGNVGGAVGSTICSAIWTNTFEKALERYLPESALPDLADMYGDLSVQLSFELRSLERIAIQQAYGYAQERILIAGTIVMSLAFIWMFMIRNINVDQIVQIKGTVF